MVFSRALQSALTSSSIPSVTLIQSSEPSASQMIEPSHGEKHDDEGPLVRGTRYETLIRVPGESGRTQKCKSAQLISVLRTYEM
jgi:hypothetical protein